MATISLSSYTEGDYAKLASTNGYALGYSAGAAAGLQYVVPYTVANLLGKDLASGVTAYGTGAVGTYANVTAMTTKGYSLFTVKALGNNSFSVLVSAAGAGAGITGIDVTSTDTTYNGYHWSITGKGLSAVATGAGNDSIAVGGASAVVSSGAGNDIVTVSVSGKTIDLGAGNDSLNAIDLVAGATVNAGDGNDTVMIKQTEGAVTVDLGAGNNYLSIVGAVKTGSAASTIVSGSDNDSIYAKGDFGTISMGDGNNLLTIVGSAESVFGGSGNDTLSAVTVSGLFANLGDGANVATVTSVTSLIGGSGTDDFSIGSGTYVDLGDGKNNLSVTGNVVSVIGGAGTDSISVTNAITYADMGDGNDTITADTVTKGGTIALGDGDNRATVGTVAENVTITAGAGDDEVSVGAGKLGSVDLGGGLNTLYAGTIKTDEGAKIVLGSDDDRVTLGQISKDASIDMGAGHDVLVVETVRSGATINLGEGDDSASLNNVDQASISLGTGADSLYVTLKGGASDTITAGIGDDYISLSGAPGGAGASLTMDLGDGDDSVVGDSLNDINIQLTESGDGQDIVSVSGLGANSSLNLGDGTNTIQADMYAGATGAKFITGLDDDIVSLTADSTFRDGDISVGAGDNTVFANNFKEGMINSGAGEDSIVLTNSKNTSIFAGNGDNSVSITVSEKDQIAAGTGADAIYLVAAEKSSIATAAGDDYVSLGASSKVSVATGTGDDVIRITTTMDGDSLTGGVGNDTYNLTGTGTATLTDFGFAQDLLVTNNALSTAGVGGVNTGVFDKNGVLTLGTNSAVQATAATSSNPGTYYYVTAGADADAAVNYVWAGTNDSSELGTWMDLTGWQQSMVLMGTANDSEGTVDTIIGSDKGDTVIAGKNDIAYGGKGNDTVYLTSTTTREYAGLGYGKDTVSGFVAGTDETSDAIYLVNGTFSGIKTTGTEMVIGTSNGQVSVTGTGVSTNTDFVFNMNGTDYNVAAVGGTYSVAAGELADFYVAASNSTASQLDFSAINENVVVDLTNGKVADLVGDDNTNFLGTFESIKGGTDSSKLIGSGTSNVSLIAGGGTTTLWGGGASSDYMEGSATGSDTFVYGSNDGKDTVSGFVSGTDENADALWLLDNVAVSTTTDGRLVVTGNGTTNKLTVIGSDSITADTVIKWTGDGVTEHTAKVGNASAANTFTYDADVDVYFGSTKDDTVSVASGADSNIWLDGRAGTQYLGIDAVDASASSGTNVVAGNGNVQETLIGGSGTNSLWGGEGASNDTLVGGGTTTAYFGLNNGQDTFNSSSADDRVMMYNANLSDVAGIDYSDSSMTIRMTDGSSLTVNSSDTVNVTFQNGQNMSYSYSTKQWS